MALVPSAKGAISKMPIGPFQKMVLALARCSVIGGHGLWADVHDTNPWALVDGNHLALRAVMDLRRDHHVGRQHEPDALAPGLGHDPPRVIELVRLDQALAQRQPRAARKVLAMPPPIRTAWHRASSASRTSSLPETFAPPMTVWNGLGGLGTGGATATRPRAPAGGRPRSAGNG